ncbi:MAG: hypothetical protein RL628_1089 [Actinomycetota bacterium]
MELLRTPDSAFANIPDWAFEPVYTNITADDATVIRVAHVDIGPRRTFVELLVSQGCSRLDWCRTSSDCSRPCGVWS